MKKIIKCLIFIFIFFIIFMFRENIANVLDIFENKESEKIIYNKYYNDKEYSYFKNVNEFNPKSKEDLINIYYTVVNSGMNSFTFYCDDSYTNCIDDVDLISNDRILLSNINNFVNIYNSFEDIETIRYKSSGKIVLNINYIYEEDMQDKIDKEIDSIVNSIIKDNMTVNDKIKAVHDYIIDNTKYDSLRSDENINTYLSNLAYGPLFQGYGICSGYSDLFKLFMDKLGVESIKISTENHIWNLVKVDNKWLHIDLTWDDPLTDTGEEIIDYEYFLITTEELYDLNDNQHYFDDTIYKEAIL